MNLTNIKQKLQENHHKFLEYLGEFSDAELVLSKNNKWTAGQHLEHIYLAVKPVRVALSLPKFLLKLVFGQANRSSKSEEELVKKYKLKLANGGRASGRFIPKKVTAEMVINLRHDLKKEVDHLCTKLDKFTEEELDRYVLPHPLLGKLTLREMLYFTSYHVTHHHELVKQHRV